MTLNITQRLSRPALQACLADWLDYLLSIHPAEIDMGLERVSKVAKSLHLLNLAPAKVITVAGTNGKGTSCAMLESVLSCAGFKVGVYSSPHLIHYNERVRIEGQDATDVDLIAAFEAIESARGGISLTFFEYATLAGLYLFKAAALDVIILEVGLGGRLDATNMIDADACLLTSIALDHQEYLGNTRALVGREKAGVFRANTLAVIGERDLPNTVVEYADDIQANLYRVGQDFSYQQHEITWDYQSAKRSLMHIPLPALPLANAATVVALVAQYWPQIIDEHIAKGITQARLAGRFETLSVQPQVIVDVAHNPHAAAYLAKQLQPLKHKADGGRVLALCAMLKDKDIQGVLAELVPVVDEWYFASLHNQRGASASMLNDSFKLAKSAVAKNDTAAPTFEYQDLNAAWHAINRAAKDDDIVIVFGSFYTVSGIKLLIGKE
jgi:dihydrofolate synthase/folylpolyglutamate synthase